MNYIGLHLIGLYFLIVIGVIRLGNISDQLDTIIAFLNKFDWESNEDEV